MCKDKKSRRRGPSCRLHWGKSVDLFTVGYEVMEGDKLILITDSYKWADTNKTPLEV